MIKNNDIYRYNFIHKLQELEFVDKIILFGSRARGDNSERADIDLAIKCSNISSYEWASVMTIIEEADTLLKIDCIKLDDIAPNSPIRCNIEREGVTIYAKDIS